MLVLIILVLRRIPSILILYKWMPEVSNWREALFCGHFGPIGVGAVFISTLAQSRLEVPQNPPSSQQDLLAIALQPIVSFVVLGSILTHGLSIPFFSAGRRTLTLSRSMITDQPDWLQWVRRVPPQEDAERLATTNANETQREGQNYMESSGLSDMSDPIPEGVKTPRRVLKFEDDARSETSKRVTEEHVGFASAIEARVVRSDS
jgi:hypothetical protein